MLRPGARSLAAARGASGPFVGWRGPVARARALGPSHAPALLWIACALVAFNFGRLNELFPAFQRFPFYRILMPVGLLALFAQRDFAARLKVVATPQGRALMLFVAAILVSVPFSLWPGGSFQEALHYLDAAVPVIIVTAAAMQSEREFAWILRALVAATIILALALELSGTALGGRLTATTTYDPNDIALAAVVALPACVWLVRYPQLAWRALGVAGIVAVLVIVSRSASRGGALALGAVILSVLFLARDMIRPRWRVGVLLIATIVLATAPAVFWSRLETLENPSQDYNVSSETGRLDVWKRGIGYFEEHPFTGVGMEMFGAAEGSSGRAIVGPGVGFKWSTAHNSYIQAAAELGIFGLIGFLGLYWPTVRDVRRATRARRRGTLDPALVALGQMLLASIIGFAVGAFFLSEAYGPIATTLAAMGMAYHSLLRRTGAVPGVR